MTQESRASKKKPAAERRFAAVLLFQFQIGEGTEYGKFRTCERRIINFKATTYRKALSHARSYGKKEQLQYHNAEGVLVRFQFVGLMDLTDLDICNEEEVWYDIVDLKEPMERKSEILPSEDKLLDDFSSSSKLLRGKLGHRR